MTTIEESEHDSPPPVRSVVRALALLSRLDARGSSLTEVAERAGIPLPTALRLMRTLERERFAVRQDDGTFIVGPTGVMLAYQSDPTGPLRWAVREIVVELRNRLGETAAFFIERHAHALCVESAASRQPIAWVCPRGAHAPAHLTVPGRLLLAHAPFDDLLDDLVPDGSFASRDGQQHTIDELRDELTRIRETGLATSDFTPAADGWGFALRYPAEGVHVGAVAVVGPRTRTEPRRDELIASCRDVIATASRDLRLETPLD